MGTRNADRFSGQEHPHLHPGGSILAVMPQLVNEEASEEVTAAEEIAVVAVIAENAVLPHDAATALPLLVAENTPLARMSVVIETVTVVETGIGTTMTAAALAALSIVIEKNEIAETTTVTLAPTETTEKVRS